MTVAMAVAVFARDLDRALARRPGRAADVVEDNLALVLQVGEEFPPGWIDRFRMIQVSGVEFLDERCVGTGEEGRRIGAHASLASGTAIGRRPINATGSSKQVRPCPIAANPDPLPVLSPYRPIAFSIAEPRLAGDSATCMPADFMASILSPAPPLPPEMIAPA